MWNRNVSIGMFVVVGAMLFAVAIFLIGKQHRAFAPVVEFYTEFADVNGLMKGAEVRVAGFNAGEVTDITVPGSPASRFRVKMKIDRQFSGLVRTDSLVTIATEGVVGNKYLLIRSGSSSSPEASRYATLPSKEPLDIADLIDKSAGFLKDASGRMKTAADQLSGTLGAATQTVHNANDLIVGLKHGKGTAGMLLQDERTATDVRQAVANLRQATMTLSHASKQADAIITDLESHRLPQKADQTLSTVQSAANHVDGSARELHETITAAVKPDAEGVDAGSNIRQSLSNLNQATSNIADDSEALKRQLFFRGFFKRRGFYSLSRLSPDDYRKNKHLVGPKNPRVWLDAPELFRLNQDGTETLSVEGKARINAAVLQFGGSVIGGAIVVEGYSTAPEAGPQLAASRNRAISVRQYIHTSFQLDLQNIGAVPLLSTPPPGIPKERWNGVCLVLVKPSPR